MLVLFDIDGTLLESPSYIHARALELALGDLYAVDVQLPVDDHSINGLTTPRLARTLLRAAGVPEERIAARWGRLPQTLGAHYLALQAAMPEQRPLPDAQAALDALVGAGVRVGLLTGNYRDVSVAKLRVAGVWHDELDLEQGAFGDDAEERDELGRIARRRARRIGEPDLVVIGDTARDVACARAAGAQAVVVNTHELPLDDLGGADHVAATPAGAAELLLDLAEPARRAATR